MSEVEYQSNLIKQKNRVIYILVALLLVVFVVRLEGFASLSSVVLVVFFLYFSWYVFRSNSEDAPVIRKRIVDAYRRYEGVYINYKDWTCGRIANEIYFYFPKEAFGIEYDLLKGSISGKMFLKVSAWIDLKNRNTILSQVVSEDIRNKKKDEFMDRQGFSRKED